MVSVGGSGEEAPDELARGAVDPLNFLFHVSSHLNYAEHSENKADKFQIHYSKGKEDKAHRPNAHLSDILIEL